MEGMEKKLVGGYLPSVEIQICHRHQNLSCRPGSEAAMLEYRTDNIVSLPNYSPKHFAVEPFFLEIACSGNG